jgi:hypothetical protein
LDDGIWIWDAGPESGMRISHGKTPLDGAYANWGGSEPNDFKLREDYLMVNVGDTFAGIPKGAWADAEPEPSGTDPVIGYVVEYERERPRLQIRIVNGQIEIVGGAQPNARYQLQSAEQITQAVWTNEGAPLTATTNLFKFVQPIPGARTRFYRVQALD